MPTAFAALVNNALTSRTGAELAAACGVDASQITRWRRGEALPARGDYKRLAAALGVSVSELADAIGHTRGEAAAHDRMTAVLEAFSLALTRLEDQVEALRMQINRMAEDGPRDGAGSPRSRSSR